jgi:hypothetical protein
MKSNLLLATIVGAIAAFLLGWLIWGVLTMDYYNANMGETYVLLQKNPPEIWMIFVAQVLFAFLLAFIFDKTGTNNFVDGMKMGALIFFLISAGFDIMFHATVDVFKSHTVIIVDIVLNVVMGGIIGGIIGQLMGRGAGQSA